MTAISSLVGFYPLVVATGAGASSRWSLGTAVFGGMLFATVLSLFLVPSLYIMVKSLESYFRRDKDSRDSDDSDRSDHNSNGKITEEIQDANFMIKWSFDTFKVASQTVLLGEILSP